jgi:hypothetical protein
MAFNTPFEMWKRYSRNGGTGDPCILSWPAGIAAHGELRDQDHRATRCSAPAASATTAGRAVTTTFRSAGVSPGFMTLRVFDRARAEPAFIRTG